MLEDLQKLKIAVNYVSTLEEEAWENFLSLFSTKIFKNGEYFVSEGELCAEVAFLLSGVMRAFYRTEDGTEYNKTFFIENSFATPLAAVIQKTESHLNFQALSDCKVLTANFDEFKSLFNSYRSIETFYRKVLEIDWVIKKEQRELRLVLNDAEERYLYFQQEYPGLENRIPQYHIASHLGITPVQLSRIRAKLAQK